MLEPHGSPMKWPGTGSEEEPGEAGLQNSRVSQARSQDDTTVHYVFQREPQEAELPSLAPKQRWAVGEDAIVEVSLKYFGVRLINTLLVYFVIYKRFIYC